MTDEPIAIGVLGYGFMGKAHANALARLPMFFPEAPAVDRHTLIGRDETALAAAADRLGFEHSETNWKAALDSIDVLYNLGPNHVHAEPSIAALQRNIPVLCEKPLAATLPGAGAMRDAAAESDAVAGCAFNYRFVPAIRHAKQVIEAGELGEIRHVSGRYLQDWLVDPDAPWTWRLDEDLAGSGAVGDLGAHTIDLANFLAGSSVGDVERVSGHLRTFVEERPSPDGTGRKPVTVDDAYTAQVEYESGAMGSFEASRVATGHENDQTIRITGSRGALQFSLARLNELEVLREDGRGYETVLVTDETDPYGDRWWPPGHALGWEHTVVHENYEFLTSVDNDDAFSPSFSDGYDVQQVLDAILRSDESGEWIHLEEGR